MSIQALSALFYANDVLVASIESIHLQGVFDVLSGLFDRVGLRTNERKTVIMACWPCQTPHAWSTEAYTRQVTGMGLSYRERLRQRVHCLECEVVLTEGFLTDHRQHQHGIGNGESTPPPPPEGGQGGREKGKVPQYIIWCPKIISRLR